MNFFDSLICEVSALTDASQKINYPYNKDSLWKDVGYSQVILQRDTAFELDGVGFNLVTSSEVEDGVVVVGDGLENISGKRNFARVCLIQIENEQDQQKAYNLIRKIEDVPAHWRVGQRPQGVLGNEAHAYAYGRFGLPAYGYFGNILRQRSHHNEH